jgi:hypothetical protein
LQPISSRKKGKSLPYILFSHKRADFKASKAMQVTLTPKLNTPGLTGASSVAEMNPKFLTASDRFGGTVAHGMWPPRILQKDQKVNPVMW